MDVRKSMDSAREIDTFYSKPMNECIRKFPLLQQFPSTIQGFNKEPWSKLNIRQLPVEKKLSVKKTVDPNSSNIPCKKLRIVSPNGKDLGEFNVKILGKDATKEQIYTLTKSNMFKPVSKPVMLTLNPLARKALPLILRPPSMNTVRNNITKTMPADGCNLVKNHRFNTSSVGRKTPHQNMIMDISDSTQISDIYTSDNETKNSTEILTPGNESHQKSSSDCTADDNSQKNPEVTDKLTTSTKDIECTANNTNISSEADKITISTTPLESKKVPSTKKNMTLKEIAESPYPKVSCERLVISNNIPIYSKVHKKKNVSTTKTAKSRKVNKSTSNVLLNYIQAYKQQKTLNPNKKSNTKKNSKNNIKNHSTKNHSKQVKSRKKNSFQAKSRAMHKMKQVHRIKARKDIMTVVPNRNNISFVKNAVPTLRHDKYHTASKKGVGHKNSSVGDDAQFISELKNLADMFSTDAELNKQNRDKDNSFLKNVPDQWNVIKKAVNSVKDEELREQALKALSDCGIGVERRVSKQSPEELKSVHDTQVQTSIFGLLDPKLFVLINKNIETIQRIQQVTLHDTVHTQDVSSQNNLVSKIPDPPSRNLVPDIIQQPSTSKNSNVIEEESDFDIDSFMNQICEENLGALQVKETLSTTNIKYQKIIEQLQKDFELVKKYDEDGMLSIHNAVLKSNIFDVQRYLMVLKHCKKDVDIMTMDGVTSLELAIKYEARDDIVKLLLQSGAQPVKAEPLHESALIISAKQSSSLLPMLVSYVSNSKLLDQVDSEGFTALHYCCKNCDVEGASALIAAGANVNVKDMKSGRTPLFHALETDKTDNRTKMVNRLLQAEAATNITNFAGQPLPPLPNDEKESTFMMSLRKSTISSPMRYVFD